MKVEINDSLIFRYRNDFINLYFDFRDVEPKNINLIIPYDGTRTIGGGDYLYRAFYNTKKFDEYNHYKFNNKRSLIELQIYDKINNKTFESDKIAIGITDDNSESVFENCIFICNTLYLSAKMNSTKFINCNFNDVKNIEI